MSASKTEIFNLALTAIEQDGVDNADQSPEQGAVVLRCVYDLRRRQLLRLHPWNFATTWWSGIAAAPAPLPKSTYSNGFVKPADCLRVLRLEDAEERFAVEENLIRTDASAPLAFKGIKDVVDTTRFDATFVTAFAALLAWTCGPKLNASEQKRREARDEFRGAMLEARSADGQEGTAPSIFEDSFLASRDQDEFYDAWP
jgi:hypothetical protein